MREKLSVLMLFARSSIKRICLTLFLITVVECGLFYFALHRFQEGINSGAMSLGTVIDRSRVFYVFVVAVALLYTHLIDIACEGGSHTGYTLRRLAISERQVTLLHWWFITGVLMIVWLFQALLALGLCMWYLKICPAELVNHQTLVLAFYRTNFLHNLLPMADMWCWVRNVALAVVAGIWMANSARGVRWGKKVGFGTYLILWLVVLAFTWSSGHSATRDIGVTMLCGLILFFGLVVLWKGEDEDEEEQPEAQV